ncbi:hypothetical protein H632_c5357p0, partial [Helicosporidium sp. ATCC 50920]
LAEADLKKNLGFKGVAGHRAWRRMRGELVKRGHVECAPGDVNGRAVSCVRLLKPWRDGGEEGDEGGAGEGGGLIPASDAPRTGQQVAERCLDRQILGVLRQKGPQGAGTGDVETRLALNMKRNGWRMRELERRYRLRIATHNDGRVLEKRYTLSGAAGGEDSDGSEGDLGAVKEATTKSRAPGEAADDGT